MSMWTYVIGCILIDTMAETNDIKAYVEKIIEKAPKITGSEQDIDIFINQLSGHNVSIMKGGSLECEEYQTCAAITLVGSLRDREIEYTKKEIGNFLKFIDNNFLIYDMGLHLSDGHNNIDISIDKDTENLNLKKDKEERNGYN